MSYATRVAKLEAAENQQLCCYLCVDARTDDIEAEQAKRIAEVRAANNVPDAYPVMLTVVSWLPAQEDANALPIEGKALEQEEQRMQANRICVVYQGEGDPDAQVAAWRSANDWPDDGKHRLQVIHVVYVEPKP